MAAGIEPALSSLRMRCIAPSATPASNASPSLICLERLAGVEPAISALATQRLTVRLQPLISGSGRGIRTLSVCGVKDHRPAAGPSRNDHPFPCRTHLAQPYRALSGTILHHPSRPGSLPGWTGDGWRARSRTLNLRGQSAASCQLHHSPSNLAAQAGIEPASP